MFWAQSPEERECRRESENSGPDRCLASGQMELNSPLTNRNVIHKKQFVKYFVKIFFGCFMVGFVLGKETNKHRLNLFKKSTMVRK